MTNDSLRHLPLRAFGDTWVLLGNDRPYGREMSGDIHRGRVKFFKAEKGWGGIESPETPGDVWVHYSAIEGEGYRALAEGDLVEFRFEAAKQDSWRYRATWVRRL